MMFISPVKKVNYINLDERYDRRCLVENEFRRLGLPKHYLRRIPAVKTSDGATGCTMSHINALKLSIAENAKFHFVVEDDFLWIGDADVIANRWREAFDHCDEWDVLLLSSWTHKTEPWNENRRLLLRGQTAGAYVVKQQYFSKLLVNFTAGLKELENSPAKRCDFALDTFWQPMQKEGRWHVFHPRLALQRSGYSNLERTVIDFTNVLMHGDAEPTVPENIADRNGNARKPRICCNFMGGLGNQLFQAANLVAQSFQTNREIILKPFSLTPGQGNNVANYVDNIFKKFDFESDPADNFNSVSELSFEHTPLPVSSGSTIFSGYFQSRKYWKEWSGQIRDLFGPSDEIRASFINRYPALAQKDTLSIHVRRSEYLQYPRIHPVTSREYFDEAIKKIGYYSHIFVFSDDLEWAKQNFSFPNITFSDYEEDYMDLWMMSMCQNFIISNSTFSWWGSFLARCEVKRVIAPSIWFGPDGPNAKDIYEDYWELVDVYWDESGKLVPYKQI